MNFEGIRMKILEVLEHALPYKWVREDEKFYMVAMFQLENGLQYEVAFYIESDDVTWELMFNQISTGKIKSDITGTGGEFQVFATVKAIVEDFINKVNPQAIAFSAKEKSRVKLYDKFALLFRRAGWQLERGEVAGEQEYRFTRDK